MNMCFFDESTYDLKVLASDADSMTQWFLSSAGEINRSQTQSKDCGEPQVVSLACKPRVTGSEQRLEWISGITVKVTFGFLLCPTPIPQKVSLADEVL